MHSKTSHALAASILLLSATAATSQQVQDTPLPTPCSPQFEDNLVDLTLSEAVDRALACNAGLSAAEFTVKAASARAHQAGIFPNPELEFEIENFAGSDELHGFDAADATIAIAQPFHLGGDRGRRRDVAEAQAHLATGDLEIRRRDLVHSTTTAFFELLAAQQELILDKELLDLAQSLGRTVEARVEAGRVSPVESTRARIETSRAEVALSVAQHRVNQAKVKLSVAWNKSDPDFERAAGELPALESLPPYAELEQRLIDAPEAELTRRNEELHEHSVQLEKALAIPDLRVSLGSRQFRDTGLSAWVAGLSIPIPVFDRNQGGRQAAEFELEVARRTSQTIKAEQHGRLRGLVERLLATANAAQSMAQVVEPAAAEAFSAVEIGYLQGKFAFAELLLAQQSLFEARRLALESRLDYALARCDLERLVGPISQADPAGEDKS